MRGRLFGLYGLIALALAIAIAPAWAQERWPRQDYWDRSEFHQDRRDDTRRVQDRTETAAPAAGAGEVQGVLRLLPADAVSEKLTNIDGRPFPYTVTAGTLLLHNQFGNRTAAVFYTAYVAKQAGKNRPITFAFNGGPGAASAYLHLGLVGPRIADFGPDGRDGATAKLRDNPETWLAFTDLVLIDPVGTGWSRPARPEDAALFRGVQSDAASVAKVIALYIVRNARTASPKYLLGESYGGFRAAKVARVLHDEHGMIPAGIVMVSPLLETSFQWARPDRDPLKAALTFPTIVATELERTKKFTPEALAEAERFALAEYLPTLAGPPPLGEQARAFYEKIAAMTSLPPETVAARRGYIRAAYIEHLRRLGIQTSSYDLSFSIPDTYRDSPLRPSADPILDGFLRALSGLFVDYARNELGFRTEITYILLNREGGWDWGGRGERPGVSEDLRTLLALNPSFRLLVAHGRSDLVTPYGVSRYLLDHIRPPAAPGRVRLRLYGGGHMFYFNDAERRAFTAEAKSFYQGSR
jgi:carboxypeptidase C (cathepsin A)